MRDSAPDDIISELFREGLIRTWYRDQKEGWILRSGKWSPFYVQLRPLISRPALLERIGNAMAGLIRNECPQVNRLVGIAMAGIPIAVATSIGSKIPAAYTRKLITSDGDGQATYGEHSAVEGELCDGDVVALVDDVVTRFDSKLEALIQVKDEAGRLSINVSCRDVCVVVDRLQGGLELIRREGVAIHSLVQLTPERIENLGGFLEGPEYEVISDYLRNPEVFEDASVREKLKGLSRAS
jgi:orotate phosphoribosyltransferase